MPALAGPVATLLTTRSALALTLKTAVAVFELLPTEVVSDPAGIVLVTVPPTALVTTLEMAQLAPGGMTAPAASVSVPRPVVAATVPGTQVVCGEELALTRLAG